MDNNQKAVLEGLAQQFNTTVEYLWEILIKQAYVSATLALFFFLCSVIFLILLFTNSNKINRWIDELEDNDVAVGGIYVLIAVFTIFSIIGVIILPNNIIVGYMNPEYWALSKIMELIK